MKTKIILLILFGFIAQPTVQCGIWSASVGSLAAIAAGINLPTEAQKTVITNFFTNGKASGLIHKAKAADLGQLNNIRNSALSSVNSNSVANVAIKATSILTAIVVFKVVKWLFDDEQKS